MSAVRTLLVALHVLSVVAQQPPPQPQPQQPLPPQPVPPQGFLPQQGGISIPPLPGTDGSSQGGPDGNQPDDNGRPPQLPPGQGLPPQFGGLPPQGFNPQGGPAFGGLPQDGNAQFPFGQQQGQPLPPLQPDNDSRSVFPQQFPSGQPDSSRLGLGNAFGQGPFDRAAPFGQPQPGLPGQPFNGPTNLFASQPDGNRPGLNFLQPRHTPQPQTPPFAPGFASVDQGPLPGSNFRVPNGQDSFVGPNGPSPFRGGPPPPGFGLPPPQPNQPIQPGQPRIQRGSPFDNAPKNGNGVSTEVGRGLQATIIQARRTDQNKSK